MENGAWKLQQSYHKIILVFHNAESSVTYVHDEIIGHGDERKEWVGPGGGTSY